MEQHDSVFHSSVICGQEIFCALIFILPPLLMKITGMQWPRVTVSVGVGNGLFFFKQASKNIGGREGKTTVI